jgi:hypothetical protein
MRRDTLGRRIGRNWWREWIMDTLRCADAAWQLDAEAASNGWATELAEYRAGHPRPTLRGFLEAMAGHGAEAAA